MADLPETPAEEQLRKLRGLKYGLMSDQEAQRKQAFQHHIAAHCGEECPYPDQCSKDPGGQRRRSWYKGDCLLYQLSLVVEASGLKKMLGQRYERSENPFVLSRIRSSVYYNRSHEPCLDCISRPKGCTYEQGRKCLIRLS